MTCQVSSESGNANDLYNLMTIPADSQQEKGDLSPTVIKIWVLPTTWKNEADPSWEAPGQEVNWPISWFQSYENQTRNQIIPLSFLPIKLYNILFFSSHLIWLDNVRAQSCPTLCHPMHCSLTDSSVQGILQARVLEWVTIFSSRESSWPRDLTQVSLHCRQILYSLNHQGSPKFVQFVIAAIEN